jgi:hypothetical protein
MFSKRSPIAKGALAQHQRPGKARPSDLKCCFVARFVRLSVKALIAFDARPLRSARRTARTPASREVQS